VCVIQALRNTESDRLCVQVNAYLDNRIDVQTLLADSELKVTALEKVAELEETVTEVQQS